MVSSRTLRRRAQRDEALAAGARTRSLATSLIGTLALIGTSMLTGCIEPKRDPSQAQTQDAPTGPKRTATIPADGWNDQIAWRGLDDGLREAAETGMPVMMVVHTSWCSNCQQLKRTFNGNQAIEQLSEGFVMVHVDQDAHPEATLYGPDGQYIPRVLFLDGDGNVDQRLQNPKRPSKFRYFYTPQEDLVATMRQALDQHGNKS